MKRVETNTGIELRCSCGSKNFGLIEYPDEFENNLTYKTEYFIKKPKKDTIHIINSSITYNI